MNITFKRLVLGFAALITPAMSFALSPLMQYNDLVAGEGDAGFSDGAFYSAQFNNPNGLTLNEDGSFLYVADTNNGRIRSIDLNNKNNVQTIAGTGEVGYKDGPNTTTVFNAPKCLAFLPENRIAVSEGVEETNNARIRVIDLKSKTVSTLAGGGILDVDGDATKARLGTIWSMVYFPANNCLYFSEPQDGIIKQLDLKTGMIKTIVQKSDLVPQPAALGVSGNKVYVADKTLGKVYELAVINNTKSDSVVNSALLPTPVWSQAHQITALAGTETSLYAYDSAPTGQGSPIIRVFPDPGVLKFDSSWGYEVVDVQAFLPQFSHVYAGQLVGFIPDSRSDGRFYVTNPSRSTISSFRDLHFGNPIADATFGAPDFTYPHKKPFRTFRILMTGQSQVFFQCDRNWNEHGAYEPIQQVNILELMSRKLELYLNFMASLEDVPIHFEVFNMGRVIDSETSVWPYYEAPKVAEQYNVDMVLMMVLSGESNLHQWWQAPLTSEGIPEEIVNLKYNYTPIEDKFKTGPLHDLLALAAKKKMKTTLDGYNQWISDPETKDKLIDIMGLPIVLLKKKLSFIKASEDTSCKLCLCYYPPGSMMSPSKLERSFWKDLTSKDGVGFLDLTDDFTATRYTYYPLSDMLSNDHFTKDGHTLMARLLAYELIKSKIIPFKKSDSQ